MTEASKSELRKCLFREAMSAEESNTDSENSIDEASSDDECADGRSKPPQKKIVVRPLSWRSDKYTEILRKLDRKSRRRASPASKAMEKHRFEGPVVVCEPPEGTFDWMIKEQS